MIESKRVSVERLIQTTHLIAITLRHTVFLQDSIERRSVRFCHSERNEFRHLTAPTL